MSTTPEITARAEQWLRDYASAGVRPGETAEIIRELLAEVQRRQWQPIETAPKDGTEVLIAWAGLRFPEVSHFCPDRRFWVGDNGRSVIGTPTHWMPLPEPPAC